MIEIGGKPILWHIMKIYSAHGINEFIVCCGYRGYMIKEYFANYFLHMSDVTIDLAHNSVEVHHQKAEPWRITLLDTGDQTQTGGRIKRIAQHLDGDFCLTYGDGVGSIDISKLLEFHNSFQEKPTGDGSWINGGFFVLNEKVLLLLEDDGTVWEREPLESLAKRGEMQAFFHHGFWQPMDTLRDKTYLESLWSTGSAPWKIWR
jgi:glucose-1-phosphate cytidylyltransferase